MGATLARVFAQAGHEVTVWNRTTSKSEALVGPGISPATTLVQAVKGPDLVVSALANYQVSAALFSDPAVVSELRGTTLLELASGTPKQAEHAARWAKENSVDYFVGTMMVTPDLIGQSGSTFLYAGPERLYQQHRATLAAVANSGMYVGAPVGHASALDNAILAVFFGAIHGVLQGAAICRTEDLPLPKFMTGLVSSWPVFQPSLVDVLTRINEARFEADPSAAATVATCHASLLHILELCRDRALDLSLPEALASVFSRAVDAGLGERDAAAVFEIVAQGA